MYDAINDMTAYSQIDDSIYTMILHSEKPELKEARQILEQIERRQHYRHIGQIKPNYPLPMEVSNKLLCAVARHLL